MRGARELETARQSRSNRRRRRRRPGRSRKRPGRGFGALLPHLFTTANLAAGFYAIVKASTGDPLRASYAIFFAGIFDLLDGRAARLTGSESRFGAEYDSIADTVSFGVAPALIAFHAGGFLELGWTGWVMAFMYTACAGLRLARFNVSSGRYRGRFDGLPSPSGAGMVVSTVWFAGFLRESGLEVSLPAMLPAIGVALIGLLMVSPIPYRSFKDLKVRGSYPTIVIMVLMMVVLVLTYEWSFFLVGLLYVASGPFEWYWRHRTGRSLEEMIPGGHGVKKSPDGVAAAGAEETSQGT
jgi:CDP-diacylglycerol--serine O-phosphatidyltransferase